MIRDASGHGRCRHTSSAETRVRGAEVLHCPNQRHAMLQGQGVTRQRPASTRQGSQPLPERRVPPLDVCRVAPPGPVRAAPERLDACRGPSHHTARRIDTATPLVAFDHLGDQHVAPGPPPRPPTFACVHGITPGLAPRPDGGAQPSGADQQRTVRGPAVHPLKQPSDQGQSRGALTSPPSHKRGVTIMASAIQTMPPCCWTRRSSACTWPRSRGGSTRYACTACPCRPARAHPSAPVRSSPPHAATIAGTGHPGASQVRTITTVSAAGRSR